MNEKTEKKILLALLRPSKKNLFINSTPPMGILSIAAMLESNGIKTKVIDGDLNMDDLEDCNIVCFSINCSNSITTLNMIKKIKQKFPKKIIVVGGPQVNAFPEYFIKNKDVDVAIKGEGEKVFLEYVKAQNKEKVKGLYLKKGKNFIFTGNQERIMNLDALPFQALGKVDLSKYDVPIKKKKPITSIMTSRGCPFKCIYCFHSLEGAWIPRSPENVVDEIEWQIKNFGVKEICIFDDNFTLDVSRAKKICDLIIKRKIKISLQLTNGIRVDRVDRELLVKMKKAGVWLVNVAPESGSIETLKKIKKGFTLDKTIQVVQWCKEIGLNTKGCFMIGFPWETKQHIEKTIEFALKLDTDLIQISRVVPFPRTELFEMMHLDAKDYIDKEIGLFYGRPEHKIKGITEEEIGKLIKTAYRKFYLNPRKILKLMRILSLRELFKLFVYSIRTESI